ncbi:MAG: polysaccharide export protein [Verrucomicrobia bacterium]|nr:polysaccharide export protein [Verrucomicrobiota bacterium]
MNTSAATRVRTARSSLLFAVVLLFFGNVYFARLVAAEATLRPGDTIELKLGGVPSTETQSVSGEYQIDGDGFVNMPNIGKVRIGGLSPAAAQTAIESVYRQRGVYTHPTIVITIQTQARFVNVGGEVKTPERVPYTADLTILASINAAGGFTPYADQRRVRLLRGTEVIRVDVKKIRANPSLDVGLQPGDKIEVPQSLF